LAFYAQPGLVDRNITFDTYPVGTGPYYLAENNPNRRMRLVKHPNYQAQLYPSDGLTEGMPQSLLADAGQRLPFIDEVIYTLEKESVPYWNKFLQGYYDASGVSSDSFDQAVQVSVGGELNLTRDMREKGVHLRSGIEPTIFYMAFNMLDEVVGGYSEDRRKLRQAISIAVNFEEFISIFMNERGMAAQGPIPPGIFGHVEGEAGVNPYVHDWVKGAAKRKSLDTARQLLAEAGYKDGINPQTGRPLQLHYDAVATGPDDRARLDWMRKQFEQLGIELVIRSTDYNRFQDKVRKGDAQIFFWGWNADYPDPENFLFLLYGPNGSVATKGAGINSANYANPEFDRLFEQIKTMENTPERFEKLQQMIDIARQDAPWIWGLHPRSLALYHSWYQNIWPNRLANNTLKYLKVDAELRAQKQAEWNQPIRWPLWLTLAGLVLVTFWGVRAYRRRQQQSLKPGGDAL
jgi:ABC-type transport system substrate-binding protein